MVGKGMLKQSEINKKAYKTGEVAEILGLTTKTIQNYDKKGLLKISRSPTNRRIILRDDLIVYMKEHNLLYDDSDIEKKDVIYARVSSQEQKTNGDLDRQALFLLENAPNIKNPIILKEVGSGLNDKRKQLMILIDMIMQDKVKNIYITYKDRLTRFGFHYIEKICLNKGINIIVVKDENKEKTVNEELVEDMMSLIASFSGKLYGMRSKGNKVKKEKGQEKENEDK